MAFSLPLFQSATTILQQGRTIHDETRKKLDEYISDMDQQAATELISQSQDLERIRCQIVDHPPLKKRACKAYKKDAEALREHMDRKSQQVEHIRLQRKIRSSTTDSDRDYSLARVPDALAVTLVCNEAANPFSDANCGGMVGTESAPGRANSSMPHDNGIQDIAGTSDGHWGHDLAQEYGDPSDVY